MKEFSEGEAIRYSDENIKNMGKFLPSKSSTSLLVKKNAVKSP